MIFYPTTNIQLPPLLELEIKAFTVTIIDGLDSCLMSQEVIKGFKEMCHCFFSSLFKREIGVVAWMQNVVYWLQIEIAGKPKIVSRLQAP